MSNGKKPSDYDAMISSLSNRLDNLRRLKDPTHLQSVIDSSSKLVDIAGEILSARLSAHNALLRDSVDLFSQIDDAKDQIKDLKKQRALARKAKSVRRLMELSKEAQEINGSL